MSLRQNILYLCPVNSWHWMKISVQVYIFRWLSSKFDNWYCKLYIGQMKIWAIQLQTGYTQLNHYRNTLGQVTTDLCSCGQTETTEHYLLKCLSSHKAMEMKLSREQGLYHIDLQLLLGNKNDDNIRNYRENIQWELESISRPLVDSRQAPRLPRIRDPLFHHFCLSTLE